MVRIDLQRVREAVKSIDPVFLGTPQYESAPLSDALGCSVVLKVETLNPVRSFKGRGTETVMSSLTRERRHSSVVCASAGNLGQALAYSGTRRGIPVTVFEHAGLVVEPSAALGVAALLEVPTIPRPHRCHHHLRQQHHARQLPTLGTRPQRAIGPLGCTAPGWRRPTKSRQRRTRTGIAAPRCSDMGAPASVAWRGGHVG